MTTRPTPYVLLLQLETTTWRRARHWSYSSGLGIEEGFHANGVDFLTITAPWYPHARVICGERKFDQVWIEVARLEQMPESWLDWMASRAPVRLGLMHESLEYHDYELTVWPGLKDRKTTVLSRLKYLTHVASCDEHDVAEINAREHLPAVWWPQAVPARFIAEASTPPAHRSALFSGALYGDRAQWLAHPDLQGLLTLGRSAERGTIYPALFNLLHLPLRGALNRFVPGSALLHAGYQNVLRHVRRQCFARWLHTLRSYGATVNLPHVLKAYPGRVVESMAAGRPVISWEVPDRLRNRQLFEPDQEILLFGKDEPERLAAHIRRVLAEPSFADQLTNRARRKLLRFHTIEQRVRQVLDWLETGASPSFG